jgi:hypothetical protein
MHTRTPTQNSHSINRREGPTVRPGPHVSYSQRHREGVGFFYLSTTNTGMERGGRFADGAYSGQGKASSGELWAACSPPCPSDAIGGRGRPREGPWPAVHEDQRDRRGGSVAGARRRPTGPRKRCFAGGVEGGRWCSARLRTRRVVAEECRRPGAWPWRPWWTAPSGDKWMWGKTAFKLAEG